MSHSRMSMVRPGVEPGGTAEMPEPPDSSFWLERTPLPTARRGGPGQPGHHVRSALAPPGTVCPKCDSPLSPSEPACPSCGLRRAMFGRFRTSAADRVPPALEELWREVEQNWSDPALHERFMSQVSLCGAYAYAASRYRRAARQRQSDAISKLQLERLSRMVHAVMAVSAVRPGNERGSRPYRGLIALLVILIGLGGIGSLCMFHRRNEETQERIDRMPPTIRVQRGRSLGADGKPAPAFGGLRARAAPHAKGDAVRRARRPERSEQGEQDERAESVDQGDQGGQGDEDRSGTEDRSGAEEE